MGSRDKGDKDMITKINSVKKNGKVIYKKDKNKKSSSN